MQTSRYQLGLIAGLAAALGFSLSSSDAVGYPAGSAVSFGNNPVRSATGHWDLGGGATTEDGIMVVPADQDLVLTEVVVGLTQNSDNCWASGRFQVSDGAGTVLANIPVHISHLDNAQPMPVQLRLSSGIRVAAGSTVNVRWDFVSHYCSSSQYDLDYVLSGYLATS